MATSINGRPQLYVGHHSNWGLNFEKLWGRKRGAPDRDSHQHRRLERAARKQRRRNESKGIFSEQKHINISYIDSLI